MALEKINWHSKPDFIESIQDVINRELHAIGLFFDLSKAYNGINHDILLDKCIWNKRWVKFVVQVIFVKPSPVCWN
jgi:hypothetical protein